MEDGHVWWCPLHTAEAILLRALTLALATGATSKEMDGNKSFEETPGSETGSKTWDSLTTLGS